MTEKPTVMRAGGYIGRLRPRKVYFLVLAIVGLVWVLYFVRPAEDRVSARASHLTEGQVRELNLAEEQSHFVDLKGPVAAILDPAKRTGVVSSLRSLIGISTDDKTPAKSEIRLDAHAERALEVLELNLGQNRTLPLAVESIGKKDTSEKIRLVPPDDQVISGDDFPRCSYNKSRDRMSNFFGESYDANLPPFLPRNHSNIPNIFSYPLPFGLQNSESVLKKALTVVSRTGFNATRRKRCLRCVVVGNGGILSKTSLGNTIDEHDVVFRLNDAPTAGYEEDVGSKTTLRMAYPESSFQNRDLYRDHWLYVVILFKPSDGEWLVDVASGKTVRSSLHFWKSVAKSLPKPADEFRIFNPLILREAATMIGFDISSGKMNKNVPTTGSLAISMATRLCDEVSVAGFGYREDKPLHYYDKSKASDMKKSWTHNIDKEKQWLQKLVVQGVIQDLTGGIVKT